MQNPLQQQLLLLKQNNDFHKQLALREYPKIFIFLQT